MSDFLPIDGSQGEGGGQVLRTAIGLSMVTGRAVRITRIRAKRNRPGLMRQHLTCVLAAAQLCGAQVEGAHLKSQEVSFAPGPVRPGDYDFQIGTAGSTMLVLQTLIPALLLSRSCDGPTRITVVGGTHNPYAPPAPFIEQVFLPVLRRMGAQVDFSLDRPGFYPAGGGRVTLSVRPVQQLWPLKLTERGRVIGREGRIILAALPFDIAEREMKLLRRRLDWPPETVRPLQYADDVGPANAVTACIRCEHASELFIAFGERGRRAESVAEDVATQAQQWLNDDVPVGPHLADQLLIPCALAGGGTFLTARLDAHAETNAAVIEQFLGVRTTFEKETGEHVRVTVYPNV